MSETSSPQVLLLRTAGTNCDRELAHAFTLAGAAVQSLHINALLADPAQLEPFQILAFPGGFSYGDDIASGKILANQLIHHLKAPLHQFINDGKLLLGVCNGFQVLVKSGLLPGPIAQLDVSPSPETPTPEAPASPGIAIPGAPAVQPTTLTYNSSGHFIDRWTTCRSYSNLCKWLPPGKTLALPIAHGEGRFVTRDEKILQALQSNDQIVFRYVDPSTNEPTQQSPANPNGSTDAIAGICDITGRVLGLMPHPERIATPLNHPLFTRNPHSQPDGQLIFQTALEYVRSQQTVTV